MLITDIVRRVRESAGDIAVLQFSNATLTDWINDAIREAVIENSLLQARPITPTVAGTANYTLPTDIFKLHSVWYDGMKLDVITLEQWEERNAGSGGVVYADGDPNVAYVYAGILTVFPTPSAVKNLQINYTKLPATIAYVASPESWTPDSPSIPEQFHNRIVTYCLAQVALQDDDFNKYNAFMSEFKTGVIDLKHSQEEDDLYPFISVAGRDQGELWSGDYYRGL